MCEDCSARRAPLGWVVFVAHPGGTSMGDQVVPDRATAERVARARARRREKRTGGRCLGYVMPVYPWDGGCSEDREEDDESPPDA